MDFDDTPEEAAFRAEARRWLDAHAEPLPAGATRPAAAAAQRDPAAIARAQAWMAEKADAGWACITWPVEYGGRAASPIQDVIWQQEEARYRTPPNLFTIGQGMLGPTLMRHGSAAQKRRHLPPLLRGAEIWCQLFSEPGAGSDLAGLRTSALRDGAGWLVNGHKIWTSGAHYCNWGMVVTRTDPSAHKHAGLTYFIVDMRSPGIEIRPVKQLNGLANFNEVYFDDVAIPDENRVGAVGDGWRGALTTLMNERATIGGGGAGGPGVLDLLRLARESAAAGATESAALRERVAEFYVRAKALELTRFRTLSALSRGATPGPEASLGKLVGARLRQQLADFALELQGAGAGALNGAEADAWQELYLAAPGLRLAGGSDEILRNIIAERTLALPAEPRSDKGVAFDAIPRGRGARGDVL